MYSQEMCRNLVSTIFRSFRVEKYRKHKRMQSVVSLHVLICLSVSILSVNKIVQCVPKLLSEVFLLIFYDGVDESFMYTLHLCKKPRKCGAFWRSRRES